uniref:Uncharacterized protein n=1 Tax=Sphaeramia orbicularis TaxID=375764 RepID=A0A673B7V8_9TELE
MTLIGAGNRMEWLLQRCHKEAVSNSAFRSLLLISSPGPDRVHISGLWSIGVQLYSAFTGSYVPGHHSVLLITVPTSRAIMERRLAASINILSRTSTMYFWKGEIQDASEFLMIIPFLSFPVEDGSLAYMKWMDEAIPDD